MDTNLDNRNKKNIDNKELNKFNEIKDKLLNNEPRTTHTSYFLQQELDKDKEKKLQIFLDIKNKMLKHLNKINLKEKEDVIEELNSMETRAKFFLEMGL